MLPLEIINTDHPAAGSSTRGPNAQGSTDIGETPTAAEASRRLLGPSSAAFATSLHPSLFHFITLTPLLLVPSVLQPRSAFPVSPLQWVAPLVRVRDSEPHPSRQSGFEKPSSPLCLPLGVLTFLLRGRLVMSS